MMSSLKPLVALAREFAGRADGIDERVDSLMLRGAFTTAEEQAQWLAYHDSPPAPFRSIQVYDPEIGGDLDTDEPFDPERKLLVTIAKPAADNVTTFFFASSAAAFLERELPTGRVLCAELEPRGSFQARGLDVAVWDLDQDIVSPPRAVPINPRKFVKDYVPDREVVEDLSPFLIVTRPAVESAEYVAWRRQSARRLMGALVSSASAEQDVVWLKASGPPLLQVRADDARVFDAWEPLTACAEWVFLTGSDVEVRHLILAVELARANRPDLTLSTIVTHALEAARSTYEAHVQSASRETLKALADLRKTVIDETQKVTQRAQDLNSGLWRDVAVSAAPFVIKILGDAGKTTAPSVAAGFYFAAAIFIGCSFGLQVRINKTFLDNQKKARARWFTTLYGYISATERTEIAEEPIETAVESYRETRGLVGLIYAALIIVLVGFGFSTLYQPSKVVPDAAAPATVTAPSAAQSPKMQPSAVGGADRASGPGTASKGNPTETDKPEARAAP